MFFSSFFSNKKLGHFIIKVPLIGVKNNKYASYEVKKQNKITSHGDKDLESLGTGVFQ